MQAADGLTPDECGSESGPEIHCGNGEPSVAASGEDDDDQPRLSAAALSALLEFYEDRNAAGSGVADGSSAPEEDWQLSQFWYTDDTAETLARECASAARAADGRPARVACVSCPTLFRRLRCDWPDVDARLFELDGRFAAEFGDAFVPYDYRRPTDVAAEWRGAFGLVACDPPHLSDECLRATAESAALLLGVAEPPIDGRVLVCTGGVMRAAVYRLLGATERSFRPRHRRNLANEFRCFANYPTTHL